MDDYKIAKIYLSSKIKCLVIRCLAHVVAIENQINELRDSLRDSWNEMTRVKKDKNSMAQYKGAE